MVASEVVDKGVAVVVEDVVAGGVVDERVVASGVVDNGESVYNNVTHNRLYLITKLARRQSKVKAHAHSSLLQSMPSLEYLHIRW